MKLVYVYPQFTEPSGTERIFIDKMNYFAEREGYEVYVLTNQQGNHPIVFPLSAKIKRIDIDVHFWELYRYNIFTRLIKFWKYNKLYRLKFKSFVAETKPDIVITSTYYFYILTAISKCPYPFVRVIESHIDKRYLFDVSSISKMGFFRWLILFSEKMRLRRIVPNYDYLIALNKRDAVDWEKYIRTCVIHNVVHLNTTGRYSDQQSKRIIFVGRYVEQKGIPDLCKIWSIVHSRHSDWHLDIYGAGDISKILPSDNNLSTMNIHIHNPETDIFKCYIESSVLLLTSIYEPFGLVMPEAMSCGLPVVAFDCPSGPSEIITDGVDGFLIKNRDRNLFADKVCTLIESPELRIKMGMAAISSSKRYSEDRIMPIWEKLFSDITRHSRQ